jgi:hypothetical protein
MLCFSLYILMLLSKESMVTRLNAHNEVRGCRGLVVNWAEKREKQE